MKKICHVTSVHYRYDTRIFLKMCKSLSKRYNTFLIVADGLGDELKDDVNFLDIGKFSSRKDRILKSPRKIYSKALEVEADLYHIHDPELMHVALKLQKKGKKVIYDSHEDFPAQLQSKDYLNPFFALSLSIFFKYYERFIFPRLSYVVAATPKIKSNIVNFSPILVAINVSFSLFILLMVFHKIFGFDKVLAFRVVGLSISFLFPLTGDIAGLLAFKYLVMYLIFLIPILFVFIYSKILKGNL
ncbi:glycosyltransferase [Acinetobacter sp. SwsAc3]|nr:glycosyltransferase [Acinetobacter sp. SwsAc3]